MTTIMEQVASRLVSPRHSEHTTAVFRTLIAALDNPAENFDFRQLYVLDAQDFELAIALISDWRFRRHLYANAGFQTALEQILVPTPPKSKAMH